MPDKSSRAAGQVFEPDRPHKSLHVLGRRLKAKALVTGLKTARASDMPSKPVWGRELPGGFDSRPPPRGENGEDLWSRRGLHRSSSKSRRDASPAQARCYAWPRHSLSSTCSPHSATALAHQTLVMKWWARRRASATRLQARMTSPSKSASVRAVSSSWSEFPASVTPGERRAARTAVRAQEARSEPGGPVSTVGTYSSSWSLPSNVPLATISRVTSGYPS